MRLLEEAWSVSERPYLEEFYGVGTKLNAHQTLYVVSGSSAKEDDVMEAARLMAAAPAMARLLRELETCRGTYVDIEDRKRIREVLDAAGVPKLVDDD